MNITNALKILKLNNKYNINNILDLTSYELKKTYHIMALLYHPDKDNSKCATYNFQKIKDAYNYLNHFIQNDINDINDNDINDINDNDINDNNINKNDSNYNNLIINFINLLIKNYTKSNKEINELNDLNEINEIELNIKKFKKDCIDYSYKLIENILDKLNIDLLEEIYIMLNNKTLINYNITNNKAIELIKSILLKKLKDYNIFIINPVLKNLLNSEIYKLNIENNNNDNNNNNGNDINNNDEVYLPLWHSELNYNNNIIKIYPILDENVKLDNDNNLIINYNNSFTNIQNYINNYEVPYFEIIVEHLNLMIPLKELKIAKYQKYIFNNIGIPKINTKDIFDVTNKGNIIINIVLS